MTKKHRQQLAKQLNDAPTVERITIEVEFVRYRDQTLGLFMDTKPELPDSYIAKLLGVMLGQLNDTEPVESPVEAKTDPAATPNEPTWWAANRKRVLRAMTGEPPMSIAEISEKTGIPESPCAGATLALHRAGILSIAFDLGSRTGDRFYITEEGLPEHREAKPAPRVVSTDEMDRLLLSTLTYEPQGIFEIAGQIDDFRYHPMRIHKLFEGLIERSEAVKHPGRLAAPPTVGSIPITYTLPGDPPDGYVYPKYQAIYDVLRRNGALPIRQIAAMTGLSEAIVRRTISDNVHGELFARSRDGEEPWFYVLGFNGPHGIAILNVEDVEFADRGDALEDDSPVMRNGGEGDDEEEAGAEDALNKWKLDPAPDSNHADSGLYAAMEQGRRTHYEIGHLLKNGPAPAARTSHVVANAVRAGWLTEEPRTPEKPKTYILTSQLSSDEPTPDEARAMEAIEAGNVTLMDVARAMRMTQSAARRLLRELIQANRVEMLTGPNESRAYRVV